MGGGTKQQNSNVKSMLPKFQGKEDFPAGGLEGLLDMQPH